MAMNELGYEQGQEEAGFGRMHDQLVAALQRLTHYPEQEGAICTLNGLPTDAEGRGYIKRLKYVDDVQVVVSYELYKVLEYEDVGVRERVQVEDLLSEIHTGHPLSFVFGPALWGCHLRGELAVEWVYPTLGPEDYEQTALNCALGVMTQLRRARQATRRAHRYLARVRRQLLLEK